MFTDAVQLESASHNLEGHLDGSKARPTPPAAATTAPAAGAVTTGAPAAPAQTAVQAQEEYERALDKWTAGEAILVMWLRDPL